MFTDRQQNAKEFSFALGFSMLPTPIQASKGKAMSKNYLTGIRETDSRIRRIVKEGSAGAPVSPKVEFGNNLSKIRERQAYRCAMNLQIIGLPCLVSCYSTEVSHHIFFYLYRY